MARIAEPVVLSEKDKAYLQQYVKKVKSPVGFTRKSGSPAGYVLVILNSVEVIICSIK